MNKYIGLEEVVSLLQSGEWELGHSSSSRDDGRYWMQRGGLSRGGETREVRASTMRALERRKLVEAAPKQPGQPFWMRRYRLCAFPGVERREVE